jgi:hypothetical protein
MKAQRFVNVVKAVEPIADSAGDAQICFRRRAPERHSLIPDRQRQCRAPSLVVVLAPIRLGTALLSALAAADAVEDGKIRFFQQDRKDRLRWFARRRELEQNGQGERAVTPRRPLVTRST